RVDHANGSRLERHSANRTRPRFIAHNLGVHRARVLDSQQRGGIAEIGFERHATLRTRARSVLPDFRIHRTDVGLSALRVDGWRRLGRWREIGFLCRLDPFMTTRIAGVVYVAFYAHCSLYSCG